jgi:hypothetical protein
VGAGGAGFFIAGMAERVAAAARTASDAEAGTVGGAFRTGAERDGAGAARAFGAVSAARTCLPMKRRPGPSAPKPM